MTGHRAGVTAIVLAGGASRRMGYDKSIADLDGLTSLERVVSAVSRVANEILIASARNVRQPLACDIGITWVADPPGAFGPLAGLSAGLSAARYDNALVVACDMPFLNPRLLAYLVDRLDGHDAAVPVAGGRAQPLHAAYSRSCLETVDALLERGAPSAGNLLPLLQVAYVLEGRCQELDPVALSWFNMNTPEDLAFARKRLTSPAFAVVGA